MFLKLIEALSISDETFNEFKTISTQVRIGLTDPLNTFSCGIFSQTATYMIQMLRSQYEIGIKYFISKLQSTVFDILSIKNLATYLSNEVSKSLLNFRYTTLDYLRVMNYNSGKRDKL